MIVTEVSVTGRRFDVYTGPDHKLVACQAFDGSTVLGIKLTSNNTRIIASTSRGGRIEIEA